jgi:DNA-directed RNA polymerase subunit RPC12/RpoP
MTLVKCPECGREISDKAGACPNCGFSLNLKSWVTRKSIFANVSWYIFATEFVIIAIYILSVFNDMGKDVGRVYFVMSALWPSFSIIVRVVSLVGILFAVVSIVRKEPSKVLAWICVVLHGAGLLGG